MASSDDYGQGRNVGVYLESSDPLLMHAAFHNQLYDLQGALQEEEQLEMLNEKTIMGYCALRLAATGVYGDYIVLS